jgi:hypothetical protein
MATNDLKCWEDKEQGETCLHLKSYAQVNKLTRN